MSDHVVLALRSRLERPLEADAIAPNLIATLGEREIASLPVWDGKTRAVLGDFFDVRGERSPSVRLEGDLSAIDGVGAAMSGGELLIAGSVGRYAGTRMTGGILRIEGSAGDGLGLEMAGGVIVVQGDAGDRVGGARLGASKGMTGGEIIVRGRAGAEVGARMRRGTIVCARTGAQTGHAMIAGSVIVLGPLGDEPGRWNKRGSLVTLELASPPLTYRYDCTYHPPHLAIALTRLRRTYMLPIEDAHVRGRWARYSGDLADLGRGEILAWQVER